MTEDEGSVDSAADAEEPDDPAPGEGAESGDGQGVEDASTGESGAAVEDDRDADDRGADDQGDDAPGPADDGFVTADPEPTGDAPSEEDPAGAEAASKNGEATSEDGEAASKNGEATSEDGEAASKNGEAASKNGEAASKNGEAASKNGEADATAASDVDTAETADADADAEEGSDAASDSGTPVSEDIVDRVAEYDEDAATEVRALVERAFELKTEAGRVPELESRVEALEDDRDDLKSKLARKQADFKNYKERQKRKQEQVKERATEDLVERLVGVRDNLKRALDQDVDDEESIRDGVEMTLKEFDRVLAEENVEEISPEEGDDVDPQRHEVMVRVDSDLPEGAIADVFNPGYEMAGRVIQAAQVTVSNGANHDPDASDSDDVTDDAAVDEDVAAVEDAAAPDASETTPETDDANDEPTDDGEEESDAGGDDGGEEAVALGGEVDDGAGTAVDADGQASDEDISAALDDE